MKVSVSFGKRETMYATFCLSLAEAAPPPFGPPCNDVKGRSIVEVRMLASLTSLVSLNLIPCIPSWLVLGKEGFPLARAGLLRLRGSPASLPVQVCFPDQGHCLVAHLGGVLSRIDDHRVR